MLDLFSFDLPKYKINKQIRIIELFAGIGSQVQALKNLGANLDGGDAYKIVECDPQAVKSYNAIHGTNFEPLDITKVHGKDLQIIDTDKYEYILTYSFPCQDLSLAGLGRGMEEDSGTRSSLLWEVKRLLTECDNLPQILLMENVPQVHGEGNLDNFGKWLLFLEQLGYHSFYQDCNSKDFGIAQNRSRCFCLSLLDKECTYEFPEPIELDTCIKDYLEENVDEKYYINTEAAERLINNLIDRGELDENEDNTCFIDNAEMLKDEECESDDAEGW